MNDLISRQAAIDELDKGAWGVEWDKTLAKAMIESLPSAQPEQRWKTRRPWRRWEVTMMRLIDADALIKYANNSTVGIDANDIARFPRVDAVPVVHGEWIDDKSTIVGDIIERYCSICGQRMTSCIDRLMPYCPNCGAKMRGDDSE